MMEEYEQFRAAGLEGAPDAVIVDLLRSIEGLLTALRRRHPDIPETVTLVVPRGRRQMLAYFSPGCWSVRGGEVDEIGITAEHLDDGVESVATSVLHEAAHARARALSIRDTSRGGRWHNRRFGELAFDMASGSLRTAESGAPRRGSETRPSSSTPTSCALSIGRSCS